MFDRTIGKFISRNSTKCASAFTDIKSVLNHCGLEVVARRQILSGDHFSWNRNLSCVPKDRSRNLLENFTVGG